MQNIWINCVLSVFFSCINKQKNLGLKLTQFNYEKSKSNWTLFWECAPSSSTEEAIVKCLRKLQANSILNSRLSIDKGW